MSATTPTFGSPIQAIEALRKDLKEHAGKDERELRGIREDLGSLAADTAEQTGMLKVLHQSVTRRAATDQAKEIEQYKGSQRIKGNLVKAIVALAAAGAVELAHRIFG